MIVECFDFLMSFTSSYIQHNIQCVLIDYEKKYPNANDKFDFYDCLVR